MTDVPRISVERAAPVVRITLAHPPLNVIDVQMMGELQQAFEHVESSDDIFIVVLAGGERAFSAGVDVAAHTPEKVREMLTSFHGVIRTLLKTRKITLAAVKGACLGGGAELALMCDFVYTARDASWAFPEIKLACYPPVAAVALSALVGQKRAADLIFSGRQISGDEALAIGLATGAARAEEVDTLVAECITRLSKLSPAALGMAKKAFYAWDALHFDKGLARAEQIYFEELIKTEDCEEGIRAFLEKRKPVWKGK